MLTPLSPAGQQLRLEHCFPSKDLKVHFMTMSALYYSDTQMLQLYLQNTHGWWHIQTGSDYLIEYSWPQMIFCPEMIASILSGRDSSGLDDEGGPESILRFLPALFSCGPYSSENQIHSILFELLELMKQNKLLRHLFSAGNSQRSRGARYSSKAVEEHQNCFPISTNEPCKIEAHVQQSVMPKSEGDAK